MLTIIITKKLVNISNPIVYNDDYGINIDVDVLVDNGVIQDGTSIGKCDAPDFFSKKYSVYNISFVLFLNRIQKNNKATVTFYIDEDDGSIVQEDYNIVVGNVITKSVVSIGTHTTVKKKEQIVISDNYQERINLLPYSKF